jgi:hypothetical protein
MPTLPAPIGTGREGEREMIDPNAGPGVIDTGEMLALDVPYDQLVKATRKQVEEIGRLQQGIIELAEHLHAVYHVDKGDIKGGFDTCPHMFCRQAKALILGENDEPHTKSGEGESRSTET